MIKKPALEIHQTFKQEIAKEMIYDNTRGSSLLIEARTGVWRTRTYRAKYKGVFVFGPVCLGSQCVWRAGGNYRHLIMFCKGLHPIVQDDGAEIFKALVFRDSEGKIYFKRVEITRRRLSDWLLKSRH